MTGFFHPKRKGNAENKSNSQINVRFVAKTSDNRNFFQTIRSSNTIGDTVGITKVTIWIYFWPRGQI